MTSTGSETLDRIQQEIKETARREEELRTKNKNLQTEDNPQNGYTTNGNISPDPPKSPTPLLIHVVNAFAKKPAINNKSVNGNGRIFAPNPSSKGVMEKFLRMRGKLSMTPLKSTSNNNQQAWVNEDTFMPAKVTIEAGKPIRNGFIPAEEKMRRELREFQKRENELRKERRKSQPNLMAALEAEAEAETNLKPARSMAMMYSSEDLTEDSVSSGAGSLKPAKSLAELCDASDEELETPGTHSLILQFEKMKNQARS